MNSSSEHPHDIIRIRPIETPEYRTTTVSEVMYAIPMAEPIEPTLAKAVPIIL